MNLELGLLGHPVAHSLSPPMHTAALKHFGLDGRYRLLDVPPDQLQVRLDELIADGLSGFNVTIPHKDAIFERSEEHTDTARRASAVNCVRVLSGGKLLGHNTDMQGFSLALQDSYALNDRADCACVLGAGGAAKAAILALNDLNFAHVFVLARDVAKADAIVEALRRTASGGELKARLTSGNCEDLPAGFMTSLVVNCTPIGQRSPDLPLWLDPLLGRVSEGGFVFDMVYAKGEDDTPLVVASRRKGLMAVDGADMLVYQALSSFEFWTGKRPPFAVMKEALLAARLN